MTHLYDSTASTRIDSRTMFLEEAFRDHSWHVESAPCLFRRAWENPTTPTLQEVPGRRVLVRSDTQAPLSVVSTAYREWQNESAKDLVRSILDADPSAGVEQVAEFRGGQELVCQVKLREWSLGGGVDRSKDRVNLWWGHDGSTPVALFGSSFRLSCSNQKQLAFTQAVGMIKVRHTSAMEDRMLDIRRAIALTRGASEAWEDVARRLAGWRLNGVAAGNLTVIATEAIMGTVDAEEEAGETQAAKKKQAKRERLGERIIREGQRWGAIDGQVGTAWDLLNRATGFIDHASRTTDRARNATLPGTLGNARKDSIARSFATLMEAI